MDIYRISLYQYNSQGIFLVRLMKQKALHVKYIFDNISFINNVNY